MSSGRPILLMTLIINIFCPRNKDIEISFTCSFRNAVNFAVIRRGPDIRLSYPCLLCICWTVRRLPLRFGALLGSVLADNPTLRGTTAHSALSEADEGICFCPLGWSFYHRVSFFTPFLPTHAEVSLSPVVKPSYNGPHQTLVAQLDFAAIS